MEAISQTGGKMKNDTRKLKVVLANPVIAIVGCFEGGRIDFWGEREKFLINRKNGHLSRVKSKNPVLKKSVAFWSKVG